MGVREMKYEVYFDGECSPKNPGGWMGYGYVIKTDGKVIARGGGSVEPAPSNTNNQAEYHALHKALQYMHYHMDFGYDDVIHIYGDSQVIINQMNGLWKVRSPNLLGLYRQCRDHMEYFSRSPIPIYFEWIPRNKNKEADVEANISLNTVRYAESLSEEEP